MLKHLGAMSFARGLYAITQAVLLIVLARDIGPQGFGVIASFLAAHTFLFLLAGMNTPTFVTREIALGSLAQAVTSIRLNAIVMSVAFVMALASCMILLGQPLLLLAVAGNAVAVWSERVTENRLALAYGEKRLRSPVVTLVVRAVVPLALYLGLTVVGVKPLIAFAAARLVAGLVSQLLAMVLIPIPRPAVSVSVRAVLRAQMPLATTTAMGALRTLDSVVVIAVTGAAVAGVYSAASRVVSPFNILAVSAAPVLVPRAAVASSARVCRIIDVLLVAGLVLTASTLALLPFTESLVMFLFGPGFAGGGPVLFWVLLRVGPVAAAPLISTALQAKGLDRIAALNSVATSLLTLAAVAVGAAIGKATGAAAGFAIVGIVGMVVLWITGRYYLSDGSPTARSSR